MREALELLLILMLMAVLVVLWRLFGGLRYHAAPPSDDDITHSIRRMNFSRDVRELTDRDFVEQQIVAIGAPNTRDEVEAALGELAALREPARTEFHLRHVVPDRLIRRLAVRFLRAPSEVGYRTLRQLFAVLGGHDMIHIWDELYGRLEEEDGNWYRVLGSRRVATLRRYLTNLRHNLFLSEAQGNLHAGTYIDLTEEGLVLLGANQVRRIVAATVEALEVFGMAPRLALVGHELMLGYDGAVGELREFGFDPRRAHDLHIDPLAVAPPTSIEAILRNTEPRVLVEYFRQNRRARLMVYGAILAIVAAYLLRLNFDRLFGDDEGRPDR